MFHHFYYFSVDFVGCGTGSGSGSDADADDGDGDTYLNFDGDWVVVDGSNADCDCAEDGCDYDW